MEIKTIVPKYDPVDEELNEIAREQISDLRERGYNYKGRKMIGIGLQGEDFT